MILWLFSSLAFANPDFEKCIAAFEKREGRKVELSDLKQLKKVCHKHEVLAKASKSESQRYTSYYLLCKNFWVRHLKYKKVKDMSAALRRCHDRAEQYIRVFDAPGDFRCEVQACRGPGPDERCVSKITRYDKVTTEICKTVIAPLKCTMEKYVPRFVKMQTPTGTERIKCSAI